MRQLFNNFDVFMAAEESGSGSGTGTGEVEVKDTIELLNEEPEEVLELSEDKPKGKKLRIEGEEDKEEENEEEDELKEIEEELKEPKLDEDIEELMQPVRRREILKKYPSLFKDFPYLEKAYYRERQFTEVFPTINDAKVAVDKARVLDNVERQVMNGDITQVLSAAKQESSEAFYKIADNYLPALRAVDQQAYYHVLGNVVKDTIITMVKEARTLGEQGAPLQAAANILNQFVFGSQTFKPPTTLSRQVNPNEAEYENRIKQQEYSRVMSTFESVKDDLQTRADNVLKSTIDQHIDPNGSMSDFVKKNANREAFETLEDLITKDTHFKSILDKLWERAFQKNFDKESTDKIKSAYLTKAKTLLPSVIKRARNDALKGSNGRSSERMADSGSTSNTESASRRGPIQQGRSTTQSSGKFKSPKDIPRGMSTLDVLMKD
jgi:hypothetical protein